MKAEKQKSREAEAENQKKLENIEPGTQKKTCRGRKIALRSFWAHE